MGTDVVFSRRISGSMNELIKQTRTLNLLQRHVWSVTSTRMASCVKLEGTPLHLIVGKQHVGSLHSNNDRVTHLSSISLALSINTVTFWVK